MSGLDGRANHGHLGIIEDVRPKHGEPQLQGVITEIMASNATLMQKREALLGAGLSQGAAYAIIAAHGKD